MKKVVKITMIILVAILLICGGFVFYKQSVIKNDNTIVSNKDLKDLDINSSTVKNAYATAVYIKKDYDNKLLTRDELIANALSHMDESKMNVCVPIGKYKLTTTVDELNSIIDSYIYNENKLSLYDIKHANEDSIQELTFGMCDIKVEDNKIYPILNCDGMIGPKHTIEMEKLVSAKQDDNHIYLYVKVAFGKLNEQSDDIEYLLYDNQNYEGEVIEKVDDSYQEKNIKLEKYKTYKYTIRIVNDKYLYESFELDK